MEVIQNISIYIGCFSLIGLGSSSVALSIYNCATENGGDVILGKIASHLKE